MKTFLINLTLTTTLVTSSGIIATHFTNEKTHINNQLYVLGDSLSDNGNLANIFTYDTYGIDKVNFQEPFYHNSFTTGNVAASVLAQKLGITLTPAWYAHGNNYAVAGAQAGQNSSWKYKLFMNHYAIDHQAAQLLKDHKLQKNDDIFLEIGGNDLLTAMDESTTAKQDLAINNAVNTEFNTIQTLINGGARNLVIANVPNISNIPKYVNQAQSVKSLANHLSTEYNTKWTTKMNELIKSNTKTNIKPFDLQTSFTNLLTKAENMGKNITNESIQWSIKGLIFNREAKYIDGTSPETINNNFFFDYIHPNKWAHNKIGALLFNIINSK